MVPDRKDKKKSKGKKTALVLMIVTLLTLVFIILSAIPGSFLFKLSGPFSFVANPVTAFFSQTYEKAGNYFNAVKLSKEILDENQALKDRVQDLEFKLKDLEEKGRRWEELKEAVTIKENFEDYELVAATVLTRESGLPFTLFRIDAGSREGIVTDGNRSYPVVDVNMNLIGRVYSSDKYSSKIMSILDEGSVVSAKTDKAGGAVFKVSGDIALKDKGLCLVRDIPDYSEAFVGDELVTSGLGGFYPAGIPIGVIKETDISYAGQNKAAILEIHADPGAVKDVIILVRKDLP